MPVQNKNNALYWATGIDNSGLKQDAEQAKGIIKNMSKDIEKTSDATTDAIDNIAKHAIDSARKQLTAQQILVKQIEQDIKGIEKKAMSAPDSKVKSSLIAELDSAKKALLEEKAVLSQLDAQVNGVADKHVMLRTQIAKVKDELARLEMQGKRNTPEFDVLLNKLGELNDQFKDTAMQAAIMADDQRGFKAVASSVSGMAGAMSAATGAVALFGSENENLEKVQMRLQAVMAITIGLQQVAEMINKDSYFSVVLVSKAKEMLAASELKLATATGVSTVAAKAFLIATGAIAIVGLVALIATINKVSEAHKEQTKAATDAAKKEQAIQAEIAQGFGQEKAKIDALLTSIHSENVSRENKLKMIKQLKEMIPGYNAELSKEGVVIRENKKAIDEYMVSLEKSLKLKAAEKELEALYTKKYKLEKLSTASNTENTNEFTKGLAKQGEQSEIDKTVQNAKKAVSKAASSGIPEVEKEINTIKSYISSNGLVSDVVLGTDKDSTKKAIKEAYDATKELNDLLLDINKKTSDLLLEQQEDSLSKRLALVEAEKQEELKAIQEKQIKIVEEYNKSNKDRKGFKALSTDANSLQASVSKIDPDVSAKLQTATSGIVAAYTEKAKSETEKWNNEMLDMAREFADKRVQIAFDYNEKIKKLESEGLFDAAKLAKNERDKAISEETTQMIENTNLYKTITDEKLNISKQATETLLEQIRQQLAAEWAAGKLTIVQMNELMEQVNEAQSKVKGDKNQNNPFAQLGAAIGINTKAKAEYNQGKADPKKTAADLAKLESAANKSAKAMAEAAGSALYATGSILNSVIGGLDQLGMLTEEQQKTAGEVIGMVDGASNIAMGIATGNPMAIIQGSIDLLVNGFKLFDGKTKAAEKEIKKQQDVIDNLKESYEELERAVDKAFSTTKARLVTEEIANLKAQNEALTKQIAAEKDKKKPDKSAIKGYEDAIKENKQTIEELGDTWLESLAGTDIMSAIDTFAQAYADAWTSGENAAKKSADVVKGILKNALINYMKGQLQPQVEGIMNSIANAMLDGQISDSEQSAIDALTSALDAKAAEYKSALDPYLEDSTKTSGVTGELQKAMTEGTASQLVGLWNMTAMDIRWIREFMATQGIGTTKVQDITQLIKDVSAIQVNTRETADNTKGLINALEQIKKELELSNKKTTSRL